MLEGIFAFEERMRWGKNKFNEIQNKQMYLKQSQAYALCMDFGMHCHLSRWFIAYIRIIFYLSDVIACNLSTNFQLACRYEWVKYNSTKTDKTWPRQSTMSAIVFLIRVFCFAFVHYRCENVNNYDRKTRILLKFTFGENHFVWCLREPLKTI